MSPGHIYRPSSRFEIAKREVVLDDSKAALSLIASALVSFGQFQPEPLIFVRGRTLVRIVRSELPSSGMLAEPVPVSLQWLRHVAVPLVATLKWSDGRALDLLPEAVGRALLAEVGSYDFVPLLHCHHGAVTATAKLAALADQGPGWHLFSDALVRLDHEPSLRVVSDASVETKRRREVIERAIRLHGGWRHSLWMVNDSSERQPGEREAAFDRMRKDLRLVRSEVSTSKTLTRIASSRAVSFPGVYSDPYDTPVVTALRRLGLIDHSTSLRVATVGRRGVRPRAVLLMPYRHVADKLLGQEFRDVLVRHGLTCRIIAAPPYNPACVGLLLFGSDDAVLHHFVEQSPGYVAPAIEGVLA